MSKYLDKIEKLARASKVARLIHNPIKYIYGIGHRTLIYPFTKKGILKWANTFFGKRMRVLLPSGMDIYLLGGKSHDSEIRLARFVLKNLKSGNTFLDIGAHFGYFSLLASSITGETGKVFCVEASKMTYEVLSQNVGKERNIKSFNNAISNQKGVLDFYEYPLQYSEYNSLDADQYQNARWAKKVKAVINKIEAHTLDGFVSMHQIKPNFIKIDVEGVEDKVVSGMNNIISNSENLIIAMEYIVSVSGTSSHQTAVEVLAEGGFMPNKIEADGSISPIAPDQISDYMQKKGLDSDNIIFRKRN